MSRPTDEVDSLDLEQQLEEDLVNVLTDDMDPKVSYRSAVSGIGSELKGEPG